MEPRRRRPSVRSTIAGLAFVLAVLAMVWPIHYKAATGVNLSGAKNQFTLTAFSTKTCPWQIRLGHGPSIVPPAPPPNSDATQFLLNSDNGGTCAAKRYDRTSEVLPYLLVGFGFTVSNVRRRRERARSAVPVTA